MFEALRDQLTERAEKIFSEIQRVLAGVYIEDFYNLAQGLKAQRLSRMESCARGCIIALGANAERAARVPTEAALSEHVANLRQKWFAEIGALLYPTA